MNKYSTILGQILEGVRRAQFEKSVKEHKTEYGAEGLSGWAQFVRVVFAQLSGRHGLRPIETGMNGRRTNWYHLEISGAGKGIKRSSLSYASQNRSAELFKGLFELLAGQAQKSL
jgi:putative transposase